ncbi:MAG TPA: hypothetical protein VMJ10_10525 [Kofleriaceae bacterium]|nr:hypothetical protein [Kofleriaceae bacterium]
MRRILVALLVAACGGSSVPSTMPMPPDPQPEPETKPAQPEKKPEPPPKAPAPLPPLDASFPAPKTTVKLVNAGKGKRAPLKLTPKAGTKQQVEIVFDIGEHQGAPEDLGGNIDTQYPSIVLVGSAEVTAVDAAGAATYTLAITGTDVRGDTAKNPPAPVDDIKKAIATVQGLTLASTIDASGTQGDTRLHIEKPEAPTARVLSQLLPLWPAFPVLPADPIGVGAKWQVTSAAKVMIGAVAIDVTHTTEFELVSHTGSTWTIKGTAKVAGDDQAQGDAKVQKIGGEGDTSITVADGALYPTTNARLATQFQAIVSGPDQTGAVKSGTIDVQLKQVTQVTPRSP